MIGVVRADMPSFCNPYQACWPTAAAWERLNERVHGHLMKGVSPLMPCIDDAKSAACQETLHQLKNPFFIESQPGATQSTGWIDAWRSSPSTYVLAAESAQEIAEAVNFARKNHIKLVIKGTGHDYLGRSNSPNSLLIWTHAMRQVTLADAFVPHGCAANVTPTTAVTVDAGARWLEVYQAVTVDHGRYVQGGGCTTVGAAGGFIQGGGFGSFSKKFGTGAAGLLEAEVVTMDGYVRIANACQNQDLFWALKGGGGGTYGIVTKVTLQTHPLPELFGTLHGVVKAKSDAGYRLLIARFIRFYREALNNEYWGEQVSFTPERELKFAMVFQGLTQTEADQLWKPFTDWLVQHKQEYQTDLQASVRPAKTFWGFDYLSKHFPRAIDVNHLSDAKPGEFWWADNQNEVSIYLNYYLSTYVPFTLFSDQQAPHLVEALFNASHLMPITLHFNKGLAGASEEAIARQKNTSMHPAVLNAAALAIIAGGQQDAFVGITGHVPHFAIARVNAKRAQQAMNQLLVMIPNAASYPNEADYFIPNWQSALWGSQYDQLLQIKRKYDPTQMLTCHHCVGSVS